LKFSFFLARTFRFHARQLYINSTEDIVNTFFVGIASETKKSCQVARERASLIPPEGALSLHLDNLSGFCYSLASLGKPLAERRHALWFNFVSLLFSSRRKINLEAKDTIRPEESPEQFAPPSVSTSLLQCAECLETVAAEAAVATRRGETLCAGCAKNYYVPCATCNGLIPQDEARTHADAVYCFDCEAQALKAKTVDALDESEVGALVSEFIALHAEEKRIKDRLDAIKEELKAAASVRERVAGAVTLSGEDGSVKCSFKTNLKCIPEKVSALEQQLEPDKFAALFERKVNYSPVRDQLEKFLSGDGATDANLRESVLAAIERTETPTLTLVRQKK
jgi:hypothetical protein